MSWRALFVIGGLLVAIGGPQHPGGTMLDMLRDPAWFRAHALVFSGILAWTIGVWLFIQSRPASALPDRWLRFALVMTTLQMLDMAVHTMAYVDADALAAGAATPVLTTHLWLTVVIYPIFGIAMIGFIWTTQRKRLLGSVWIGWLGMLGAAGHGAAGLLVVGFEIGWASILFPFLVFLALWFILAGVWPSRQTVPAAVPDSQAIAV
jgi:hypothetical protein